jgi:type IV secretion system protein VirB2
MVRLNDAARRVADLRAKATQWFARLPPSQRTALFWSVGISIAIVVSALSPEPAYAQNLESFASKVRGLLSSTLLRTLAVIAVIVCGLLWFTGRASTTVLITVIIGIAIVFSADSIVGLIAG